MKRFLKNSNKDILSEEEKVNLANLIRKRGKFPAKYRKKLWLLASGGKRAMNNNPGYYFAESDDDCLDVNLPEHVDSEWDHCVSSPISRPLLESYSDMPDPYKDQILLDLNRTFTDDKKLNHSKMLNILRCYAKRNSAVGYCQGMNYLGGMLTRVMPNEEEAFWTMWCLFESILPLDYFWLMTEVLVDQKVFILLIQKYKTKLFKHLKKTGLDFALISFQWFVCLLSANLPKKVAEAIWDFMFLEGTVSIFRAALAILNILEPELLKIKEFNDLYVILDSRPKEVIKTPEIIIKHMSKFMSVKPKLIDNLRNKNRPMIMKDQKHVWLDNSRAGWPSERDSYVFKRIKLLNKFFMLNKAIRQSNQLSVSLESNNFTLANSIWWSIKWPTCLYDFTIRSRISNFFAFKVTKPVKIINNYFGVEDNSDIDGGLSKMKFIFVPYANKNVTIYDTSEIKQRKRLESEQSWL